MRVNIYEHLLNSLYILTHVSENHAVKLFDPS